MHVSVWAAHRLAGGWNRGPSRLRVAVEEVDHEKTEGETVVLGHAGVSDSILGILKPQEQDPEAEDGVSYPE